MDKEQIETIQAITAAWHEASDQLSYAAKWPTEVDFAAKAKQALRRARYGTGKLYMFIQELEEQDD